MAERRILVVLPHPDDEAFGMSGTLAKEIREGAVVTFACLTLGEMGRNMGIPPFASRVTLPVIRKKELEASCAAIGIQDLRMLGFHDKTIEFEDPELLDRVIGGLLEELRPSTVLTFYPGYSVHPDHDACGAAVVRAVSQVPEAERPPIHCIAFSKNVKKELGEPDIVVDIRDVLDQKMASIKSHQSQFQAAELLGKEQLTDEQLKERYGKERFWTYQFKS
ncbi:bacillithiol biosynthesis deacetylase BshB2 [Paenibacillus sp. GCM10027627]|uniref:bacillithiol biosynthesis deacetylase BshB2 n=1 Tax=unclassified Paenibacillus TaxID=185978 RepID=UPI00363DD809